MTHSKEWFSDRIREHENGLYALAFSYVKNEADAGDCLQNAILKAYEHLGQLSDPDSFKPWIYGILVNCCKDELKRRGRVDLRDDGMPEQAEPEPRISRDTRYTLLDAVMKLEPPYRTVLLLHYYEDMAVSDIARVTGRTPGAVRKQLERGRTQLKAVLLKEGFFYDE